MRSAPMRAIAPASLTAVALMAVLVVAWTAWGHTRETAQADPGLTVAIDTNPADGVGTNPVCGPINLAAVDECIEVESSESGLGVPGPVFDIEVVFTGLPDGENVAGLSYILELNGISGGPPAGLTAHDHDLFIECAGGAGMDLGDAAPDYDGNHVVAVVDLGAAEANPPYTGGVLDRSTLDVTGLAPGNYLLGLTDPTLTNSDAVEHRPDEVPPAWIAVDEPCSPVPPTPAPTATATPSPTPSPTATATPSPTAVTTHLEAGWNHVCYLGPSQPIQQALADVGDGLLAVYRLGPGQGYDKWFPDRPGVSTITNVDSYQTLFLLIASSLPWTQEPAGPPADAITLVPGWNSVCYTGQTKDVELATAGISGEFGVLYVLGPGQTWQRFVPGRPDVTDLAALTQFRPLLILLTQQGDAQWAFDP